jgi:hypothetical protein
MLVRTLLGKSIDGMKKEISCSATYSNERIAMENWYEGHLTNHEFYSIVNSSDISSVKDWHDPIPWIIFWLKTIKKYYILWKRNAFGKQQ